MPTIENPRLLRFLAAVQLHLGRPGVSIEAASGYDPLGAVVALRTAVLLGLVECDEEDRPRAITPAGWAWVLGEIGPLTCPAQPPARAAA